MNSRDLSLTEYETKWSVVGDEADYPIWNQAVALVNEKLFTKAESQLPFNIAQSFGVSTKSQVVNLDDPTYRQAHLEESRVRPEPVSAPLQKLDPQHLKKELEIWTDVNLRILFTDKVKAHLIAQFEAGRTPSVNLPHLINTYLDIVAVVEKAASGHAPSRNDIAEQYTVSTKIFASNYANILLTLRTAGTDLSQYKIAYDSAGKIFKFIKNEKPAITRVDDGVPPVVFTRKPAGFMERHKTALRIGAIVFGVAAAVATGVLTFGIPHLIAATITTGLTLALKIGLTAGAGLAGAAVGTVASAGTAKLFADTIEKDAAEANREYHRQQEAERLRNNPPASRGGDTTSIAVALASHGVVSYRYVGTGRTDDVPAVPEPAALEPAAAVIQKKGPSTGPRTAVIEEAPWDAPDDQSLDTPAALTQSASLR